jgi:small subunit ribosomal protein S9
MAEKEITFEGEYIRGLGRRKASVAQARLYVRGKGRIFVNGKPMKEFFTTLVRQQTVLGPLTKIGMNETADVSVKVSGGGQTGQADATRLAIARALLSMDEDLRVSLKSEGFLHRDPRVKERKKPGLKKARRAPQWSKR